MKVFIGIRILSIIFLVPALVSFVYLSIKPAFAVDGIYKKINFQGKLVNADGTNVANGNKSVVFTIYNADAGGTNLWDETQTVSVSNGIFRVALGDNDPSISNINFNSDSLYLGIKVESDAEMTPRIRLSSVPYAFNADKLNGVTATQSAAGFTLTGGSSTLKTLTLNDNITLGLTIQPSSANGLTVQSNGANILTLDTGGAAALDIGRVNTSGITIGKSGTTTTIDGGLTVTTGRTFTFNTDAFTDLTGNGLAVSSNALIVNLTSSGNTGLTSSNSGLEVGSSGLTLLKGCSDGQLLEYTDAGGWACANDDSSAGGGGGSNWTLANGALRPNNNTADLLIGGTSTGSAKFAFMNLNGNGLTPLASFSGNLLLESRPNPSAADQFAWTKISQTAAGTVMSTGTQNISSISAMAVYNGSLYVGTFKQGATGGGEAEVYRYKGAGQEWEKVSHSTAGTIGGVGTPTADIASVSAMTVFDGRLYIGTSKMNAAEIYRYDGGTGGGAWTLVSGPTAGTFGATANIDGISSMAVYQGTLYAGAREHTTTAGTARLFRYNGGITGAAAWTPITTTAGQFVATNTVGVWAVTNMVVKGGYLYLGVLKPGDADVLRYQGGAAAGVFLSMNLASLTGSYLINGTAQTAFDEVTSMAVYNGSLVVGLKKNNAAEVLMLSDGGGTQTVANSWRRLNFGPGQMVYGGTQNIDAVSSIAVYNNNLYIGTLEGDNAEIYRYTGGDDRFLEQTIGLSDGQLVSGDTTSIDGIVRMIQYNGDLVVGTQESGSAELYKNTFAPVDSSYALKFHAKSQMAGGEQNSISNYASMYFLASASANLGSNTANSGSFIFSHGIQTRNGSYDVAEDYPTRDDTLEPGDVVGIDPNELGLVRKSEGAYDYTAIGVYSENPALKLSQADVLINGSRAIPVALAGRVPVKVSAENGAIKPGDFITSSGRPGIAMKATRTGVVLGQAMQSFEKDNENPEKVGKILIFVRTSSYNGSIAESFTNISSDSVSGKEILTALQGSERRFKPAEIMTDKLVAGLEIISPNIIADTLIARRIQADQIEGLEFILRKSLSAENLSANTDSIEATNSSVLSQRTQNLHAYEVLGEEIYKLQGLEVNNNATFSADLRAKSNVLIEGVLSVIDTLRSTDLIATGLADFFGVVNFRDAVIFKGRPIFNNDTAGYAVIQKDMKYVDVTFTEEYEQTPVINANISFDLPTRSPDQSIEGYDIKQSEDESNILNDEYRFIISRKTTKGFRIILNKTASRDIIFSWLAIAVEKPVKSESTEQNMPIELPTLVPTAVLSPLLPDPGDSD